MSHYRFLMLSALPAILAGCADDAPEEACSTENVLDDGDVASARLALTRDNKALVTQATRELFDDRDLTAIDRYWSGSHREVGSEGASGLPGFGNFARRALSQPHFAFETLHAIADGELVAIHGRYVGLGEPRAAVDVFRVSDGKIVEHWGALQPATRAKENMATQTSDPFAALDPALTEDNRALVRDFVETVLVDSDTQAAQSFLGDVRVRAALEGSRDSAVLERLFQPSRREGAAFGYRRLRRVIAEADFVLTEVEGDLKGRPHAFYDLFRVEQRRVVEHWDVVQEVSNSTSDPGPL
jgi:predicted SnoaL-like aldol condensation-catalyzing enzyme